MSNFRLPRKLKKSFKRKFLLYPADENGNSLMAQPTRLQKDYDAWKGGILRELFDRKKKDRGSMFEKLDIETVISDEALKAYINDIFREDIRAMAFRTFMRAKESETAKRAYYQFINAYQLYREGDDSYGNICCLALDLAEDLLRKENTIGKNRK